MKRSSEVSGPHKCSKQICQIYKKAAIEYTEDWPHLVVVPKYKRIQSSWLLTLKQMEKRKGNNLTPGIHKDIQGDYTLFSLFF